MPTFDFQCAKCKTVFEFSRPFGAKTSPSCPACKSKKTEKLFSTPTVVFKGAGWYKTEGRKPDSAAAEVPQTSADVKEAPKKDAKDAQDSRAQEQKPDTAKPAETKTEKPKEASKK